MKDRNKIADRGQLVVRLQLTLSQRDGITHLIRIKRPRATWLLSCGRWSRPDDQDSRAERASPDDTCDCGLYDGCCPLCGRYSD